MKKTELIGEDNMDNIKNIVIAPISQQKKSIIDDELFVSIILVYVDYTIKHVTTYIQRKHGFEDTKPLKYMLLDFLGRKSQFKITETDEKLITSAIDDFYKTGIPESFKQ